MPEILKITRINGLAGQVAYVAEVQYEGEKPSLVQFDGSVYGGPVVMSNASIPQGTFVTNPSRFGDSLCANWIRRFFA